MADFTIWLFINCYVFFFILKEKSPTASSSGPLQFGLKWLNSFNWVPVYRLLENDKKESFVCAVHISDYDPSKEEVNALRPLLLELYFITYLECP